MAELNLDDEGISIVDYLAWFAEQELPSYLDGLRRCWKFPTGSEAMLRDLFEHGDPGFWIAERYRARTGRVLFVDTHELLEQGFARLHRDPALRLMWRSQHPGAKWEPVDDGPPFLVVPRIDPNDLFVADKLLPLMYLLAEDRLDFDGRRHLIWVFPFPAQQTKTAIQTTARVPNPVTLGQQALGSLIKNEFERGVDRSVTATVLRLEAEGRLKLPGNGEPENLRRELVREVRKIWHEL